MEKEYKYGDCITAIELKEGFIFTKELKIHGRESFIFKEVDRKGDIICSSRVFDKKEIKLKNSDKVIFLRKE